MQRADLESRQSSRPPLSTASQIVQRADLESRQSCWPAQASVDLIVQRADLESRQSLIFTESMTSPLCKERIWNQGKAPSLRPCRPEDCAKSGFGIKAKQGLHGLRPDPDCAKSGFGIKAKHGLPGPLGRPHCAKSGFGIKAKPVGCHCRAPRIVQRADLESRQSSHRARQ